MAEPHVDLLLAFTNSVDHDEGTDDLTTPSELVRWLRDHGLMSPGRRATPADLRLARDLRDALHEAMAAHHDGREEPALPARLSTALPLRLELTADGPTLVPAVAGVRGALASVLAAVSTAASDGSWSRLKICAADDCAWAYVDTTKNRSRAWCEWGCGNKVKTRNYRARRKAESGLSAARTSAPAR